MQIPELINTDMAFYILRYWGKNILNILSDLFKINVSLKYFSVKDFFVSYDGKKIKMANLLKFKNLLNILLFSKHVIRLK